MTRPRKPKGPLPPPVLRQPRALALEQRQREALELRIAGVSYGAIAAKLRCDHQKAFRLVTAALEGLVSMSPEYRAQEKAIMAHQLDEQVRRCLEQLIGGADDMSRCHIEAVIIKSLERKAKLLGLDTSARAIERDELLAAGEQARAQSAAEFAQRLIDMGWTPPDGYSVQRQIMPGLPAPTMEPAEVIEIEEE